MKILFIVPYPLGKAPSQRFRFEQYFPILKSHGIRYEVRPFLTEQIWEILYQPGRFFRKALAILGGILKRMSLLFKLKQYDYLFIHREAAPIGPPIFEWVAAKILRKKIIYDFDDAIWIPNFSEANSVFSFLKGYPNVKHICRWSYKISCGNDYLCRFAANYNPSVWYNPTTIDTENLHNRIRDHHNAKLVIGWTGSHSTIRYLDDIIPILANLEKSYDFEFLVISDVAPEFPLRSLKYIRWNKGNEINDLLRINIGIMPLLDDKWAKGKCGFKALQYMSLGIPALVSPVGVNTRIVDHGVNGYICHNAEEWHTSIEKLLLNREDLIRLASNTRRKIEEAYSVKSNTENFLKLFS
jgi:glycosyltransferase involved in cell wall biosynthesis